MLNSNWYFFSRSVASFDCVTSLLTSSYSEVSLHFSITLLLDFVWARGDNMASHKNVSRMLSKTFEFSFKGWQSVIYDKTSRCHLCYFQDEGLAQYSEVARLWTPENNRNLTKEVLGILEEETGLGITEVSWIKQGGGEVGDTLAWIEDRIFIQCGGVHHPFDIVSTTIHEIAHQMVFQTPHKVCKNHHCAVWQRCTRILTARFASAKKATPLLKELADTYGSQWSNYIVQAATTCACYGKGQMDEEDDITAHGYYTVVQMEMMVEMKKQNKIKSHQKEDTITTDDDEEEEDEGEEDIIMISDEEDGWQVQLEEEEEGWEFWL